MENDRLKFRINSKFENEMNRIGFSDATSPTSGCRENCTSKRVNQLIAFLRHSGFAIFLSPDKDGEIVRGFVL